MVRHHLLRSKTAPPPPVEGAVPRRHLVERLAAASEPIWLLSAPAGYGKTTTLTQAAEVLGAKLAWITVDRADNDPVRFWSHVAAAVWGDGDHLEAMLDGLDDDRLQPLVDELVAELESRDGRTLLVLDDLHEIDEPGPLDPLVALVNRPVAGLTLAITTRRDPDLPIARARAAGRVLELRANDLAFTGDEASAVLGGLSGPVLDEALQRTEGWPTALQLLAVSTAGGRDTDDVVSALRHHPDVADFLTGEVLDTQTPDVQRFLIETSCFEELDPDLCDVATTRVGSLTLLRDLARRHVFIRPVDATSTSFRCHALFREVLRARARELAPERLDHLHRTAADWYERHDDPGGTIRHRVAHGDHTRARATLMEHYLPYSEDGRIATVADWLELYGAERVMDDTELRLVAAWAALNTRRYDEVEVWLVDLEGEGQVECEVHALRSHLARHLGELDEAARHGQRAVDTPVPESRFHRIAAFETLLRATVLLGGVDEDAARRHVAEARDEQVVTAIVHGFQVLAHRAAEAGRLDEAEDLADQALGHVTTPRAERFHQPVLAWLTKSRSALARGRAGDAGDAAGRAAEIARFGREPLLGVLALAQQARVAHAVGDRATTTALLRQAEEQPGADHPSMATVIRNVRNDTRFAPVDDRLLPPGAIELSDRELAVLRLLPHRLPRRELAAQLYVSENTVKTHLTSIRHKLGVTGREDLLGRATELGLLDAAPPSG